MDLPKASKLAPNPVVKFILDNWQVSGVTTFAKGLQGESAFQHPTVPTSRAEATAPGPC